MSAFVYVERDKLAIALVKVIDDEREREARKV
jgi:hypothetical protein